MPYTSEHTRVGGTVLPGALGAQMRVTQCRGPRSSEGSAQRREFTRQCGCAGTGWRGQERKGLECAGVTGQALELFLLKGFH